MCPTYTSSTPASPGPRPTNSTRPPSYPRRDGHQAVSARPASPAVVTAGELLPQYLTPHHLEQLLGLSRRTIDRMIASGEVQAQKIGARVLLPVWQFAASPWCWSKEQITQVQQAIAAKNM